MAGDVVKDEEEFSKYRQSDIYQCSGVRIETDHHDYLLYKLDIFQIMELRTLCLLMNQSEVSYALSNHPSGFGVHVLPLRVLPPLPHQNLLKSSCDSLSYLERNCFLQSK
jgi:hypothetical protein